MSIKLKSSSRSTMVSSSLSRGNPKFTFKSPSTTSLYPTRHASPACHRSSTPLVQFGGDVNPNNVELLVFCYKLEGDNVWVVVKLHQFNLKFLVVLLPNEPNPPWFPLTAFAHMIVYPEAALGCLLSTIFVSVSTANSTPICAIPTAACVSCPPPPINNIPRCHPKYPATLQLKGRQIVVNNRHDTCATPTAKNKFSSSFVVTNHTSGPSQPHVLCWNGRVASLVVV
jgi:hypothetical protein